MDYCPEIAVFHAAFQLVHKQADGCLSSMSKESSRKYMKIIKTAVEEICKGLEQDIDQTESEAWNQKLHLMCLYSVINHNYRAPMEKQPGRVPVRSSLEMVAGVLPKFSSCFYFEILNTCSWTHLFVECLEHLDRSTATTILHDYLDNTKSKPVDQQDTELITMVTEKILCNCFVIPTEVHTFVADLLKPLRTERRYVQIVYPDNKEEKIPGKDHLKHSKDIRNDTKSEDLIDDINGTDTEATFWNYFMKKYPDVIVDILDNFDNSLDIIESQQTQRIDSVVPDGMYNIAKISLYWYIHVSATEGHKYLSNNSWFANNFFLSNNDGVSSACTLTEKEAVSYYLNVGIFEKSMDTKIGEKLLHIVNRAINVLHEQLTKDVNEEKYFLPQDICVLRTGQDRLYIKNNVLLRMVWKTLSASCAENTTCAEKLFDLISSVKPQIESSSFILGDDWSRDVTLEALLWRIINRLTSYEECLKNLLSERCWSFWKSDRVYEVIEQVIYLLNQKTHILKCINITTFLLREEAWPAIPKIRQVLCQTFSKLSTSDKDFLVGSTYIDESLDMQWIMGVDSSASLCSKVTNTFNKVTSELDDQVLNEIFLHCLVDPVIVFQAALEMCVKNVDQALNFAKILCRMPVTCKTQYRGEQTDRSLIMKVVEEFLREKIFTEKEEKHFIVFLKILMKETGKENSTVVLPPTDFMSAYLLDAVNVANFLSPDYYPVRCGFALSLVVTALECGSNSSSDWQNCGFEPVILIVNLAGILHECTEVWEEEFGSSAINTSEDESEMADTIVTGYQKLAMKESIHQCLEMLTDMVLAGYMTAPDNETVHWLLTVTEDLNWIVRVKIAMLLLKLGYVQAMTSWRLAFQQTTSTWADNLSSVLLMATLSAEFKEELWKSEEISTICYDDLISALVQILPNLLISEVQHVVSVLELFVSEELVVICYRSSSHTPVPLTDVTSIQATLCTSQVLRDVILTLAVVQGQRRTMLKHVLQCHVTVLKAKCSQGYKTAELFLFTLSQLFHHMCAVVETLPQDCVDNGLVLLLHLLTKFKDVTKETASRQKEGMKEKARHVEDVGEKFKTKLVKNLENSMQSSVYTLPDVFEEKHMLVKKLNE